MLNSSSMFTERKNKRKLFYNTVHANGWGQQTRNALRPDLVIGQKHWKYDVSVLFPGRLITSNGFGALGHEHNENAGPPLLSSGQLSLQPAQWAREGNQEVLRVSREKVEKRGGRLAFGPSDRWPAALFKRKTPTLYSLSTRRLHVYSLCGRL